ncbi:MAG: TCP-1/cpn60 chaperonin family protein [Thermoplasmatales archaeon]|nr:TCP-1/cpn60 chaperonin family protein [Thermoplasmatales archaeon]
MLSGQIPILVLKEGSTRESGKDAQRNNIEAAKAIADTVKSALGPKGMDKMLVDSLGDITISNDGATIMKQMDVDHPTAKMIIEIAKGQDQEVGDGTTTAVIIAGELLKQAELLLDQHVHPTIIANGYKLAANKTLEILANISDKKGNDEILKNVALTAMTGKNVGGVTEFLAKMAMKAVKSIVEEREGKKMVDVDNILVQKKFGGGITDSELIEGVVIDKEKVHPRMPNEVKNSKIALIDSGLEIKKTEIDAKIQITDPSKIQSFLDQEEETLRAMVDKVKKTGANVLMSQKGIDDLAQHFLAKEGIYSVRRVKKSDMEKIAKATGAKIITNLDDLSSKDLGNAEKTEERKIGDDKLTFITGCKYPKAVSILIRGGTQHTIDEVERALHDALKVVGVAIEDGSFVTGGGAIEAELAYQLKKYAPTVGGREQLAIETFANALEIVPRTLAENAGMDPIDSLLKLRSEHQKGNKNAGIDTAEGEVGDLFKKNVVEPVRVKSHAIEAATEVATMILRIDDVISSKKSRSEGPPGGMPPGGMGGMEGMGGMPPM